MNNNEWIHRMVLAVMAFGIGSITPRMVELESTAPVVFEYQITKEAAALLVRKHNDRVMECQP